jgi:hypothetical protein
MAPNAEIVQKDHLWMGTGIVVVRPKNCQANCSVRKSAANDMFQVKWLGVEVSRPILRYNQDTSSRG